MWIRTDEGRRINLDWVETIWLSPAGQTIHIGEFDQDFDTPKAAQAAMDRLEKWLASGGMIEEEPTPGEFRNTRTQVFSFRTLSEDDEFKEVGK